MGRDAGGTMRIFAWRVLDASAFSSSISVKLITEDTVFAGTGTDEVFSCRSRLMDGGVYAAPVNLPFHKDP